MRKVKIGIIGCGVISNTYIPNILTYYTWLELVAVADMFPEKARQTAETYSIPKACTVDELLADKDIEIVVNLTIPAAHFEINMKILQAGKHVYCEKPMATTVEDARATLDFANKQGLMLGCAPDTFLGAGIQTARQIIDAGFIGTPVAATANLVRHGHESWHPAPEFYYKPGGGPMMDMGPYYITALVSLLGRVDKTTCYNKTTFPQRMITSPAQRGKLIDVEVPTHYSGLMSFDSGVICNINMSFDVWLSHLPCIEIYGTTGTLTVPDPNMFGGPVTLLRGDAIIDCVEGLSTGEAVDKIHSPVVFDFFKEIPLLYQQPVPNMRGLGLSDMAFALVNGREHRATGELAYHVTEVLSSFDLNANTGKDYKVLSTCRLPDAVPVGLPVGYFD